MFPFLIELIYYALASNDIRVLIFGLLKDYFKNKALKSTLNDENVSDDELDQPYSLFNPNILKKLLSLITPDEINNITSAINIIKNIDKTLINAIKPSELRTVNGYINKTKKLNKLFSEKDNTKDDKETTNKDSKGWTELSSSWFKKGSFKINDSRLKSGLLTGLFQSDFAKNKKWYGPYTYPSFPQEIWIMMTQAKGKNGTGAGSVFWKYWLRSWLPSKLRAYVKKNLKDTLGITRGRKSYYILKANGIKIQKTNMFIHRLERGFFKLSENKKLPNTQIGSKAYRADRREMFTYHKKNNSIQNIGISIYKNNNTYKKWK